jgi:hypothetical protein
LLAAFGPSYHSRPNGRTSENQINAAMVFARADFVNVRRYGKRFIVRADEMLTAFMELQGAIHEFAVSLIV